MNVLAITKKLGSLLGILAVVGQSFGAGGREPEVRNRSSEVSPQTAAARQFDAQGIQALMREVGANQDTGAARLERYSYILKRTEHQLNEQGEGVKYRFNEFRVFPHRLGGVAALLSMNGQELSAEESAKEKARANKEWQKLQARGRKLEAGGQKSEGGKSGEKMVPWYETLAFTMMPAERIAGTEVIVLSFVPRSDYEPGKNDDKFMAGLKGQIWIDPAEKMIVRFHAELTRDFNPLGRLHSWLDALKPGTQLTIENARLANGLWAVKLSEMSAIERTRGPLLLSHTHRFRIVDEMSEYRLFDPEAKELFAK